MFRRTQHGRGNIVIHKSEEEGFQELKPWSYQTQGGIFSTPVIGDNEETIYVGSSDFFFYSVDSESGNLKFRVRTDNIIDSAAVVLEDGKGVVFPSADGFVYNVDPKNGEIQWKFRSYSAQGQEGVGDPSTKRCYTSWIPQFGGISNWFEGNAVVTEDGAILAGADDFRLYSMEQDGAERWKFYCGPITYGSLFAAASTFGDRAIFGALNFLVYSVNTTTGECLWSRFLESIISSTPAITDDEKFFYIGSWDGYLWKLKTRNGDYEWRFQAEDLIYSSPAIDEEGNVYFTSVDGKLYKLSSNGTLLWSFDTLFAINSSPAIINDYVLFGGGDSYFYCIDKHTGELVWRYRSTDHVHKEVYINASPALGTKRVFYGTEEGKIYGLPYDYCCSGNKEEEEQDPNCECSFPLPDDGEYLSLMNSYRKNVFDQKKKKNIEEMECLDVHSGSVLTLSLVVRRNGFSKPSIFTRNDEFIIRINGQEIDKNEWEVTFISNKFLQLFPKNWEKEFPSRDENQPILLEVEGFGQTVPQSTIRNNEEEEQFSISSKFSIRILNKKQEEEEEEIEQFFVFEELHLNFPPMLVSFDQIGFNQHKQVCGLVYQNKLYYCIEAEIISKEEEEGNVYKLFKDSVTKVAILREEMNNQGDYKYSGKDIHMVTGGPELLSNEFQYQHLSSSSSSEEHNDFSVFFKTGCYTFRVQTFLFWMFKLCNNEKEFAASGRIRKKKIDSQKDLQLQSVSSNSFIIEEEQSLKIHKGFYVFPDSFSFTFKVNNKKEEDFDEKEHIFSFVLFTEEEGKELKITKSGDDFVNVKKMTEEKEYKVKVTLSRFESLSKETKGVFVIDLTPIHIFHFFNDEGKKKENDEL